MNSIDSTPLTAGGNGDVQAYYPRAQALFRLAALCLPPTPKELECLVSIAFLGFTC